LAFLYDLVDVGNALWTLPASTASAVISSVTAIIVTAVSASARPMGRRYFQP